MESRTPAPRHAGSFESRETVSAAPTKYVERQSRTGRDSSRHDMTGAQPSRCRCSTAVAILAIVAIGLFVRKGPIAWPRIGKYAGDVLWAIMFMLLITLALPRVRTSRAMLAALVITSIIECNKLLNWPWLNACRATTIGGLLLGHAFLWRDFVSYAIGVALGGAIDRLIHGRGYRPSGRRA